MEEDQEGDAGVGVGGEYVCANDVCVMRVCVCVCFVCVSVCCVSHLNTCGFQIFMLPSPQKVHKN